MYKIHIHPLTLTLMLAVVLLSSCSRKYKIDGKSTIAALDGKTLSLRAMTGDGQWLDVDSAGVEHGAFKMSGTVDSVMMVTLCLGDDAIMPIILERGKVKVSISNADARATGTTLNNLLYEFIDKRNEMETKLNEMDRREAQMILEGGNLNEIRAQLAAEAEALTKDAAEYVEKFIKDNYENVLGPSVFIMVCSQLPYPVMTAQIEDIMRTAPMSFKQNVFVQDYLTKAKENMRLIEEHRKLEESAAAAANQARNN